MVVCWISAGVSSAIAGYLAKDVIDKYIYIDIADQHPDSIRFIKDIEKLYGKEIEVIKSEQYSSVEDCVRAFNGFRNAYNQFAPCTNYLKKRVRKQWEEQHSDEQINYVWGFDSSKHERNRAERVRESNPQYEHIFPLIERNMSKEDAHALLKQLGIARPYMYELGYPNNNCIGCVKGGKGYWNAIRRDFPQVFESRAKLERELNATIIKGVYLDSLPLDAGREQKTIDDGCSIFCIANI